MTHFSRTLALWIGLLGIAAASSAADAPPPRELPVKAEESARYKEVAAERDALKARVAVALGAVRAVNYRDEDFVEAVRVATGGEGANVILDMVGGDYVERNLRAAALDGRIVQIAFLKGSKVEIDLMRLMLRRLTLTGSTLRAQTPEAKARMAKGVEQRVWPLIAQGTFKPVIDSTFSLVDAADAHRRIEDPGHIGKIVLKVR